MDFYIFINTLMLVQLDAFIEQWTEYARNSSAIKFELAFETLQRFQIKKQSFLRENRAK